MLQADLYKLLHWSNKWQIEIHIEKCKVMHFGYSNPNLEYTMGGARLMMTEPEIKYWCCDLYNFLSCITYS